jgi:hypothetical protein
MALQKTQLVIESAPLPQTFKGKPDDLRKAIVERLLIKSPGGTVFINVGDSEPNSNVGPWLKEGKKLYVYDEATKRYVPQDVSDSTQDEFVISESTPLTSTPAVWLRTLGGQPVTWYFWNGLQWVPGMNIVQSGPTANRPTSPFLLQQYYDSDISALLWWERSAWRTVSGNPGDIKIVQTTLLSTALTNNPGWSLLGAAQQSWRGRLISQATQDAEQSLTVALGIAQRSSRETFGETDGVSLDGHTHGGTVAAEPISGVPYPPTIALWHLVKE